MTIQEDNHDKLHSQVADSIYAKTGHNFLEHLSGVFVGIRNQVYPWRSTFSFKLWHNIPVKFGNILWP